MVTVLRHPAVTFVRSRATRAGIAAGVIVAIANLTLASEHYRVPFNSEGAMVHGLPLLSLLWGLAVGLLIQSPAREIEEGVRRVTSLRLTWAVALVVGCAGLAVLCTTVATAGSVVVAGRNAAAGAGLALLTATIVGWRVSWLPVIAIAAPTFFWGVDYWTPEFGEVIYAWALPLHAATAVPAAVASAALAIGGTAMYTWRDVSRWGL